MTYKVALTPIAEKDVELIMKSYPKSVGNKLMRILTDDLVNHPRTGIGKPKQLVGDIRWTRRLDDKNRIQYLIQDDIVIVTVIKCLGHNDDK